MLGVTAHPNTLDNPSLMASFLRRLFLASKPEHPRRHPRTEASNLRCTIGAAIDISMGGMQVTSRTKPIVKRGEILPLWIEAGGQRLHLRGRVAWLTRRGRTHRIGIAFMDLDKRHQAALEQLARFGCFVSDRAEEDHTNAGSPPASTVGRQGSTGGAVRAGMVVEDLYAILGLPARASQEEITARFRKMARELHPDAHRSRSEGSEGSVEGVGGMSKKESDERFTLLHKAYSVLRDPALRQRYDAILAKSERAA
jgi:DnaJ domain/PilZ domain